MGLPVHELMPCATLQASAKYEVGHDLHDSCDTLKLFIIMQNATRILQTVLIYIEFDMR